VIFTSASGAGALSAAPVLATTSATTLTVSVGAGLAANDLVVLGAPGSPQPCTLYQITGVTALTGTAACGGNATSCSQLARAVSTGLNPAAAAFTTNPVFGFTTGGGATGPAVVSKVGTTTSGFHQSAFAVQCNSLVRYDAFNITTGLPACTTNPLSFGTGVDAIATDVVLMRAQYGISDSADSDIVTSWVNPSGGTWGTPTAANVSLIKALRVVLVARSKEADVEAVTPATCTNANSVANTGPCSFQDAAAPVIDLSGTSVGPGKTWRYYRYRVHRAIIPLRNVIWSDS
jgi:type IV pilus assembly protein PilW